jgi:glycosyltransferase involved in cell wall biosynthesis
MSDVPLVSVVIPTFNRVSLLKETVESVRTQTYRDFEIIVIDDGSTDGTWQWLIHQTDIRAFRQPNQGIAASRNHGISRARGEWIAFLDHDDLWMADKLQIQMDYVATNPDVALVSARHVRLGKRIKQPTKVSWISGDLFAEVFSQSFIHTSSVIIRKDVLQSIEGFDPQYRFADEFDVWLKISRQFPIAYINKPLVLIRFYDANTSHDRLGLRQDTQDILFKHYDQEKIPESLFRKTMSDHDISYGRAYLGAGNLAAAVECFWNSILRTPLRPRSWRYFLKYKILKLLLGPCRGVDALQ